MLDMELDRIEADRSRFAADASWAVVRQYGESHGLRLSPERDAFTAEELLVRALEFEGTDQPVAAALLHYAALLERNDRDAQHARARAFAYYRR